ncbi:hypothetical protein ACIGBN_14150 [Marinomonas sp. NPDC078689]|uniref:capsular polysaccharide export protein, LipB/KpsS family n=1 Tax=Marinomonas sp. NPDC078689 TaxID=3364147 RepID=UPI0037CA28A7
MKVLVYLENMERTVFFTSLSGFFEECDFIFFTDKYSIFRNLSKINVKCYLLDKHGLSIDPDLFNKNLLSSSNFVKGHVNKKQAKTLISSIVVLIEREKITPDALWLFNGEGLVDKFLMSYYEGIKTLFFEVGNFPGKMFVDEKGVNAKSTLMENRFIGGEEYSTFDYSALRNDKKNPPPQAKMTINDKLLSWIVDLKGVFFNNCIYFKSYSLSHKANVLFSSLSAKKYINKYNTVSNKEFNDLQGDYFFVPLQVSNDTQLMFNSDVDVDGLINYALESKRNVIIKFHPAERDARLVKRIFRKYRFIKGVYFSSKIDTPTLIEQAEKVITINSNVGLEAILQKRSCEFLGRTIYKDFQYKDAVAYINEFLVNISYPKAIDVSVSTKQSLMDKMV